MPSEPETQVPIHHFALCDEWQRAVESGTGYRRSTLGASLDEVGFIHCSFADQVQRIADLVYSGRSDVVLLVIDRSLLRAEVRVENLEGGNDLFPHIYGSLSADEVVRAEPVGLGADGRLAVGLLLGRSQPPA